MKRLTAEKINDKFQHCYAVFVGDKKLTLPLSESDAKTIVDRYNGFEELQTENLQLVGDLTVLQIENSSAARQIERLKLQVEVLSAAFANSSKREKELMAEKAEVLQLINGILAAEKVSNGICDCIDNNGVAYQSAFLAGVLYQMEVVASKNKSA